MSTNEKQPLITIIVPLYMVEKYVKCCLDSILNQDYKNFEVLMIDDGTKDKSGAIAKTYIKDKRFKYFKKENGGISSVRNFGIKNAAGDYICFIDSDDYVEPNFISELLRGICDSDLCICYYATFDDLGNYKYPENMEKSIFRPDQIWGIKAISNRMIDVPWNKMYKKEILKTINYPDGKIHEDSLVVFSLLKNCSKISLINKSLYFYRQRSDSIMGIAKKTNNIERFNVYFYKIDMFLKQKSSNMAADTFFSLLNDINKNKSLIEKKIINGFIDSAKLTGKEIVQASKLKIKNRVAIYLFLISPKMYFFLRKKH